MNKLILTLGFALATSSGTTLAAAQEHHHDIAAQQSAMKSATTHTGSGVLKAVNAKAKKVQIAHNAIDTLNWPPMTMWFTLRDALPQDLKLGDAVYFELMQDDNKQWAIIKIIRK